MDRDRMPASNSSPERVEVPYRGAALLRQPMLNKGTAFTHQERALFGLEGLLPAVVSTMDQQCWRAYANLMGKGDPLERYIGLLALQDRNEHLFYRVLLDHPEELLPVVYGPVLARACREFSHLYRRGRGLWITPEHRGRIDAVLRNGAGDDVRLVVATDNEDVVGLGDQGAGGMAAATGKLVLYTVAAGIHPAHTLPVSLDVGTDNPVLLEDELYLGWRYPRLRGPEYDSLVDEFVRAVKRRFPDALLAWEGLGTTHAFRLLDRYQRVLPCFNEEAQGTAALALAAVLAAERSGRAGLAGQRFLVLGAGTTTLGVARLLRHALRSAGLGAREVRRAVAVVADDHGLLVAGPAAADPYRAEVAWPAELATAEGLEPGRHDVEDVVARLEPTVLIGTAMAPHVLGQAALRAAAHSASHPLVVPLAAELDEVAAPALVFPGIGLGCLVGRVHEVTDGMFVAAARALAETVRPEDLRAGGLLPGLPHLRRVAQVVARSVLREARDAGVGLPFQDREMAEVVEQAMWVPTYPPLAPPVPRADGRRPGTAALASRA